MEKREVREGKKLSTKYRALLILLFHPLPLISHRARSFTRHLFWSRSALLVDWHHNKAGWDTASAANGNIYWIQSSEQWRDIRDLLSHSRSNKNRNSTTWAFMFFFSWSSSRHAKASHTIEWAAVAEEWKRSESKFELQFNFLRFSQNVLNWIYWS